MDIEMITNNYNIISTINQVQVFFLLYDVCESIYIIMCVYLSHCEQHIHALCFL
jgi:hypothetical protein